IPESAHLRLFLEFDWLSTELGSIDAWSTTLRRMVTFLMSDMRPAAMFWGENRITMYNEAYARTTGQKHPGMMGKKFAGAWAELEGEFTPVFERARKTGISFVVDDAHFEIDRQGYLEGVYFSLSILPFLVDEAVISFVSRLEYSH
ncbi:hypothetical protein DL95DRAFT_304405, partial [Leptodontidium sp. 2 PMI_412]